VEFAEVGAFIDTPVKRYSSGMFVRLAFAVAAHLEPEILLIDEVLAVGDAGFQKKCLGKMSEVSTQHGRTVFFVSHNMGAMRQLCGSCVLIEGGEVQALGDPAEVIKQYLNLTIPAEAGVTGQRLWPVGTDAPGCEDLRLRGIRLVGPDGEAQTTFEAREDVTVEILYELTSRVRGARFDLSVLTQEGDIAFVATDHLFRPEVQPPGFYKTVCTIPGKLLNRRSYVLKLQAIVPGERALLWEAEYLTFTVSGAGNQSSNHPESWPGIVCPTIAWTVTPVERLDLEPQRLQGALV
jgi:lipopolysaccharide transport system ATP-binding protein